MSKTYIDREAALNKLRQIRDYYRSRYNGAEAAAIAEYCRDALIDIPTAADVEEVRHGQWILDDETGVPICSECHSGKPTKCVCSSVIQHTLSNYEIRYCYFCGAKMDGGVNDAVD